MSSPQPSFRSLLVLARASNLPTVWSNCLAGWLLGGGGDWMKFALLCLGATFLYTGGMFLNDAFDADFDRHFRPERPIPSGAISEKEVWRWGWNFLALGTLLLVWMNWPTAILTALLVFSILLYDAVHKVFVLAPVIMALCRLFLYVAAASAAMSPVGTLQGIAVWSAIALAAYIVGLSYLARKESMHGPLRYWPCLFLATPLFLAFLINDQPRSRPVLTISAALVVWIFWCLRHTFWSTHRQIGRTVSGLLAGIVLVDVLAVANQAEQYGLIFGGLFVAARLFQKFIPAT
jgi:hypothetical protein